MMNLPIELEMVCYLILMCIVLMIGAQFLTRASSKDGGSWLPVAETNADRNKVSPESKREFEIYALKYTAAWIGIFGIVIVFQMYESFTADSYMALCVPLALPFLLQPILFPLKAESKYPLHRRYSFKANIWIAIFSFIGNYWYTTHYFYNALKAYTIFPILYPIPTPP